MNDRPTNRPTKTPPVFKGIDAMPGPEVSAENFAKELITITKRGNQYIAVPKNLNKFLHKNPRGQKIQIAYWLKAEMARRRIKCSPKEFKQEIVNIYEEVSPLHSKSNLAKIKGWVKSVAENAAEAAGKIAERKARKLCIKIQFKLETVAKTYVIINFNFEKSGRAASKKQQANPFFKKLSTIRKLIAPYCLTVKNDLAVGTTNAQETVNKLKPRKLARVLRTIDRYKRSG